MCCKTLFVPEISKAPDVWCKHCKIGEGCTIYAERPQSCRDFDCQYLRSADIAEHWKPAHSRMVISLFKNRVCVHVDPDRSDAWRREPYHSDLREWAANAAPGGGVIAVYVGYDLTVVLPDRDVSLGRVGDQHVIRLSKWLGTNGIEYDPVLLKPGDPRLRVRPQA